VITLGLLPIYSVLPALVHQTAEEQSATPLYLFVGSTSVAVLLACGVISTTPAYEAQLFGAKNIGAIHGRMLMFNSLAAVAGPTLFIKLRSRSEMAAIDDLMTQVDPAKFQSMFKVPTSECAGLIEAKTLTIPKLMQLVPATVQNPMPFIYDTTMYTMAALVGMAVITHGLVKPVDMSKFEVEGERAAESAGGEGGVSGAGNGQQSKYTVHTTNTQLP
jgi:hypothetical protein